jgi:hypothetical protein
VIGKFIVSPFLSIEHLASASFHHKPIVESTPGKLSAVKKLTMLSTVCSVVGFGISLKFIKTPGLTGGYAMLLFL